MKPLADKRDQTLMYSLHFPLYKHTPERLRLTSLPQKELNNVVTVSTLFAEAAASFTWPDWETFHNKESPTKSERCWDTLNHFYTSACTSFEVTSTTRAYWRWGLSVYFFDVPFMKSSFVSQLKRRSINGSRCTCRKPRVTVIKKNTSDYQ